MKCGGIVDKTISFAKDIKGHSNDKLNDMRYFHTLSNIVDHKVDEVVYMDKYDSTKDFFLFVDRQINESRDKNLIFDNDFVFEKEGINNLFSKMPKLSIQGIDLKELMKFLNEGSFAKNYNILFTYLFLNKSRNKNIDINDLLDKKYNILNDTLESLMSMGTIFEHTENFYSNSLQFSYLKSCNKVNPYYLLDELVNHCYKIQKIIKKIDINDSKNDNIPVFLTGMLEDLILGFKKLGLNLL